MRAKLLSIPALVAGLVAGYSSLAQAALTMGADGATDVFLAHSIYGNGSLDWRQYGSTGNYIGETHLMASWTGDDVAYIRSVEAFGFNGSTANVAYLNTNSGWSDVRMQVFNTDGSRHGALVVLEPDSSDGYRKFYTGMDIQNRGNGAWNLFLTGLNESGQSTIFLSQYQGTTRSSQTALKTYSSDVGLQAITAGDWDNDGNLDIFVGRMNGTQAAVSRLEFDTEGNLLGETDSYLTLGLWDDMSLRGLEIADINGKTELLLIAGQPSWGGNSAIWKYQADGIGGYTGDGILSNGLENGYYWQDASVLAAPEPTTAGLLMLGGLIALRRVRIS